MENVMLNISTDRIKIVDFGLSNIFTGDSPLRTHCGSPEYAAPELFVEGKHYGPEVDLWSLGVILYGMVVGQLPFVSTSRDSAVTSHQQRRKRLLEQINKGLSTSHRKALALFSTEFRAMMAKLLVADSSKRINIGELVFHPWVTEKGRKSIRSNPMKNVEEHIRLNILKDVAALTNLDWLDVQNAVKTEQHGNIAGIYNLIIHQHRESHLGNDPITGKSLVPHLTPRPKTTGIGLENSINPTPKTQMKRHTFLKSAPIRRVSKVSSPIEVNSKACGMMTPRTKPRVQSSKPTVIARENGYNYIHLRRTTDSNSNRCFSLHSSELSKKMENVEFKKNNTLLSPHLIHNITRSPAGDAVPKSPNYDKYDNLIYSIQTRSIKSKMEQKPSNKSLRTQSANITSGNCTGKSPQVVQIRRPLTTGPIHTAERAAKRRSMLPVMTGKWLPKGVPSAGSPTAVPAAKPQKVVLDKVDGSRRHVASPVKCFSSNKIKDFSNEPIARSIAGYVTKNITNKLEPLKWAKGAKINVNT